MRLDSPVNVESTRQVSTGTSTDTRPEDAGNGGRFPNPSQQTSKTHLRAMPMRYNTQYSRTDPTRHGYSTITAVSTRFNTPNTEFPKLDRLPTCEGTDFLQDHQPEEAD